MHVLYVCAHSVGVSLAPHVRDLQLRLDARQALTPGDSLKLARDAQRRVAAVERLAGSYLHTRWPGALTGEHRGPNEIPRLEDAVARWDLHAHRALAGTPTTANLTLIARVEQHLTVAAGIIGAAAASRGSVEPRQHTDRVAPAVTSLGHAWGTLAVDLHPLLGRQRRLDPQLLLAGSELQAALREVTHDRAALATPDRMAARVDLAAATAVLQRGLAASVDLAHVVRDALADPALTVSARGAHVLATAHAPPPGAQAAATQVAAALVSAGDRHHNRGIRVPEAAQAVLTGHAEQVIARAVTADSAGAADPPRSPPASEPPRLDGREHQHRPLPGAAGPAPRPTVGCER